MKKENLKPNEWTNVGFNNKEDVEEFKEMISEHPAYQSIEILDETEKSGPDGSWIDLSVYIGGLEGKYQLTIYNDTEGNWDCFWA